MSNGDTEPARKLIKCVRCNFKGWNGTMCIFCEHATCHVIGCHGKRDGDVNRGYTCGHTKGICSNCKSDKHLIPSCPEKCGRCNMQHKNPGKCILCPKLVDGKPHWGRLNNGGCVTCGDCAKCGGKHEEGCEQCPKCEQWGFINSVCSNPSCKRCYTCSGPHIYTECAKRCQRCDHVHAGFTCKKCYVCKNDGYVAPYNICMKMCHICSEFLSDDLKCPGCDKVYAPHNNYDPNEIPTKREETATGTATKGEEIATGTEKSSVAEKITQYLRDRISEELLNEIISLLMTNSEMDDARVIIKFITGKLEEGSKRATFLEAITGFPSEKPRLINSGLFDKLREINPILADRLEIQIRSWKSMTRTEFIELVTFRFNDREQAEIFKMAFANANA